MYTAPLSVEAERGSNYGPNIPNVLFSQLTTNSNFVTLFSALQATQHHQSHYKQPKPVKLKGVPSIALNPA